MLNSKTSVRAGLFAGEAPLSLSLTALSRERAPLTQSAVVVVRVARHDVHEVVRPHLDVERRGMSDAISDGHMLRRAAERRGMLPGLRRAAPAGGAAFSTCGPTLPVPLRSASASISLISSSSICSPICTAARGEQSG